MTKAQELIEEFDGQIDFFSRRIKELTDQLVKWPDHSQDWYINEISKAAQRIKHWQNKKSQWLNRVAA